ncbi:MAG: hypothetical protein GF347_04510 [Candidatus Moranbacteria bacterium]|nr:hypothetical protein [Candidatus Moranbacteria bacterium]
MQKTSLSKVLKIFFLLLLIGIVEFFVIYFVFFKEKENFLGHEEADRQGSDLSAEIKKLDKDLKKINNFKDKDDFRSYLEDSMLLENASASSGPRSVGSVGGSISLSSGATSSPRLDGAMLERGLSSMESDYYDEAQRVSSTNVQVQGIDEPDIVKTDGKNIYFSKGGTSIFEAFPPENLKLLKELDQGDSLLVYEEVLVVFSSASKSITGFDVSDPADPQRKWHMAIERDHNIQGVRLYEDEIFLVTSTGIDFGDPCPIRPLAKGEEFDFEIACNSIYYPKAKINVDSTYNVLKINVDNGDIKDAVSFVGSSWRSVVYMSDNSIYVTYNYSGDLVGLIFEFMKQNRDLFNEEIIDKFAKLSDYEISMESKLNEMEIVFEQYLSSLDKDERLRVENEIQNKLEDYFELKKRELEKTGIAKIDKDNFKIEASGVIPGFLLNQFSMDEFDGYLRVATTVGDNNFSAAKAVNDLYVLDDDLEEVGHALDMGRDERIYSARFIGERGYIVTFREVDPFYVLDLSDPQKPEIKGELKIPGYSSYLHPVKENLILGIGEEDNRVKLSLFDVSNPANPVEKEKYLMDEFWSEAVSNHHAFLMDHKHQVFFLPASKGAYIFSYKNDDLELVKAIDAPGVQRAVYLDDYLYIITQNGIIVLNESDWLSVKQLDFDNLPEEENTRIHDDSFYYK